MPQETFTTVINNIFFWIIWFFELVGALIIIAGALVCLYKYVKSIVKKKRVPVKLLLANQLALGLEFMLAAEILKTVITANRNVDEILVLVAIVLLRVVLTLLLHWELKNEEKQIEAKERKAKKLANETKESA